MYQMFQKKSAGRQGAAACKVMTKRPRLNTRSWSVHFSELAIKFYGNNSPRPRQVTNRPLIVAVAKTNDGEPSSKQHECPK